MGFEVVKKLAFDHGFNTIRMKMRAHFGEGIIRNQKVMLIAPQTFMNLSGECVRDFAEYYKPDPDRIIVVYDDVALSPGDVRVRAKGSAGGHNGMKNIIYHLETDEFPRVRVGIGQKPEGCALADYVTGRFRRDETELITAGITAAAAAVETILSRGLDSAMNEANRKKAKEEFEGGDSN
jgi:PTH1 family peptidyl-tRNA hydrolase